MWFAIWFYVLTLPSIVLFGIIGVAFAISQKIELRASPEWIIMSQSEKRSVHVHMILRVLLYVPLGMALGAFNGLVAPVLLAISAAVLTYHLITTRLSGRSRVTISS